jgi:imidazole glycerol phosphate synthase glutamine amidotransferase subunit
MKKVRIIARLDIKGPNVIKGIQFECLRVMGKPKEMAQDYYLQGADELIYLDTVANLYQRQKLLDIVHQASESVHIPFTIGGGVRTLEDIQELLKAGADKVAINTAATKNPQLIFEAAKRFGSQCIVVSIEAKRIGRDKWEAHVDHGRQSTGLDAIQWAKKAEALGAGEILLTSVDMDGTERGFDIELIKRVSQVLSISLVVSGGAGNQKDFIECIKQCKVDGIAAASIFHYRRFSISEIKEALFNDNIPVRRTAAKIEVTTNPRQEYDIVDYNKFTLRQLSDEKFDVHNIGKSKIEDFTTTGTRDFDIGVINYGINNLKSVIKSFEKIGKKARWIDKPHEVLASKCLVLPGVGAFEYGMSGLRNKGLIEAIKERVKEGIPLFGICLGMQLLFEESEEFGLHQGLNLIPGRVISLKPPSCVKERGYKVPHIGWNELQIPDYNKERGWKGTVLESIESGINVYFVHSFYAVPKEQKDCVATVEYGEQEFCVAVERDNVFAAQFHPEKSGEIGLEILRQFCRKYNM